MIDEEATFKKFGYYSSELSHGSDKRIIAICDECGKMREIRKSHYHSLCISCVKKGKILTEEHKANMSAAMKGKKNPNYGVKMSEEQKAKISAAMKGKNHPMFGKHRTEEVKAKISAANKGNTYCLGYTHSVESKKLMSVSAHKRMHDARPYMTAQEKVFQDLCIKYNLPFKFVGDGALWLGNANPDFIHNTEKIVIEVFGDYWHSPLLNRNLKYVQTVKGRTEQLKKEGYKSIFIWESDLKRKDAEAFVLHTVNEFIEV